ncbi:MAG: carbohydrate kinase [Lamprobacter sp.]|uniref:carbohydrate kinase family protein n=1 Tax=Lamprobacter sp. TaxID=3100796 RepID=UPI002B263C17|nr:carbohydrate kinase [Lamprobacter sp.]MEA3640723.1 carbohydrate kinase [Lamprobacter sp.]
MPFDHQQPPLVFGEALFDCFPDGAEVLGGAPFNVAWHLAAFGLNPVFLSRVGEDDLGKRIDAAMREQGMTTLGLQRDPEHATGTVQVSLAEGEPSYEILPDRAYDHIDAAALPPLPEQTLLYHGSLALRHSVSADALRMLRGRLSPSIFLDVNLRDPWWQKERLIELLEGATWVKLNADELALLAPEGENVEARAQRLRECYELEALFATLGAKGAFAVEADGAISRVAPTGAIQVVDAVGAGDGFASVLILGLIRRWPVKQTLDRAQSFASAIVGQRGATVPDPEFYAPFLKDWGLGGVG